MTKKTRLIILIICVLLFFLITPYIVGYSLGYRIDFENRKIVATGGVYIKAWPQPTEIYIDLKLSGKTSMISNSFFAQNLLPKQHTLLVKKDGYLSYQKTLDIRENQVTRIEHIILFKEKIPFELLTDTTQSAFLEQKQTESFEVKKNSLYALNTDTKIATNLPLIKNISAFVVSNNNIIWLGTDGNLYSSDLSGKNTKELSVKPIKINKNNEYVIIPTPQNLFIKENNILLVLNQATKEIQTFYSPVNDFEISPDNQKILFYNNYEIYFSYLNQNVPEKIFLNRFSEKITDCQWINNDYIAFVIGDRIKISEIDNRNEINIIEVAPEINSEKQINIESPQIIFNHQNKKLYISTDENILVSEPLIP